MRAQRPLGAMCPGDPPEAWQRGPRLAATCGLSFAASAEARWEAAAPATDGPEAESPEERQQRYLQRKERLRRKREESAGTYGAMVRRVHISHDSEAGGAAAVTGMCADHGLTLQEVTLVGMGSFGRVWGGQAASAAHGLEAGQRVAVKVIRERFRGALATKKWTEREIQAMLIPRHEHLVHLFKAFADGSSPVLCMEYCPGGSVHELIHRSQRRHVPSMLQRLKIGLDIARGMAHLHSQNILHRDLKPSNVMLLCELDCCARRPHAKVGDFGLARFLLHAGGNCDLTLDVGSPVYRAPELCSAVGSKEAPGHYDLKADVFSFSVLVNELLTEEQPFVGYPKRGQLRLVLAIVSGLRPSQAGVPDDTPPEFVSIVTNGWAADPSDRPDFEDIGAVLWDCHRASVERSAAD